MHVYEKPLFCRLTALGFAFLVAGIIGWLYELACGIANGEEINLLHGGLGIPFLTVYAVGALAIELALARRDLNLVSQLLLCCLITTVLEYVVGALMLYAVGVQTWDYRNPGWDFLVSPDGFICLRATLTFGVLGILLLRVFDPLFDRAMKRFPAQTVTVVWTGVLIVVATILNANLLHVIDLGGQWQ